jgi:hypothetical protein
MAKQIKTNKPVINANKADQKIHRYLVAIPVLTFLAKLITMANTQGGGWLGADGENYFKGVDGLYADGLFSKAEILNYWPAGYPILLWLLILVSVSNFVYLISFIQSIFFAYATYYLTRNLSKTSLAWLAFPASLFISFNPTLSLSTLAVGYEAPVAACFMMILGVVISSKNNNDNPQLRYAFYAGAWVALASFMQPRYLLAGLVIFIIWALSFPSRKIRATVASIAISVMLISPFALIARNVVANDSASISTNLGVTMSIGAGDETRGGYTRTGPEVPCSPKPSTTSITDNQLVVCVLKWYVSNPMKTIELAFFKSTFFWSPWSGPLENGTMARNPWLKVAPTVNIAKTQSGAEFLNGAVAKLISWGWILGQLALLFYGYLILFNGGAVSRVVANSTLSAIVISWLISIGTIGDHRFRIPTMGLSLLLQIAAIWKLKSMVSKAL